MAVYEVAHRARQDMVAAALRARNAMQYGIEEHGIWRKVSPEDASAMYWTEVRKILREAHVEVNPDSPIASQCRNCKKVTMVARDVKTFRCHCSSYEEQWVCKSRYFDAQSATRILDM